VAGALGATNAVAEPIIAGALVKIKDVLSKGGSVKLDDFGTFAAKWTKERLARNPATGQPIILKRAVRARRGPFPARGGAPAAAKSRLCRGR
jgi:nucleoid DNA-binding protein